MLVVGRAAMRQAAIDCVLHGVDPTGKVILPPEQRGIRALYVRWAQKLGSKVQFSRHTGRWQGCTCPHVVKAMSGRSLSRFIPHAADLSHTSIDYQNQRIRCFLSHCECNAENLQDTPIRQLDIFGLTMYLFGIEFMDAVKMILDEFGIPYQERERPLTPEEQRQLRVREALQAAMRQTIEWLQTSPEAAAHRKYLAYERGISDQPVSAEQAADPEFWRNFPRQEIWDRLGWGAFLGKGKLRDWLREHYADVYEDLVEVLEEGGAGEGESDARRRPIVPLVYRRPDGTEVDAAYDRIAMWTHYRGIVTQCAARAIYEHPAKNKNLGSAQHLMNLERAQKYNEWIMVEGQMCLATLELLGWENVVCCYGSNGWKDSMLSQAVGTIASGGRGRVINLALDHDLAGIKATIRIGRLLESAGCEVYVIVMPYEWKEKRYGSRVVRTLKSIDFNDILRQSPSRDEARRRIEELYQRRITLRQFEVYAAQFEFGELESPDEWVAVREKIRYARAVLPVLATVSPAEEEFLVQFWAELLRLPPEVTREQIRYARKHAAPGIIGLDELAQRSSERIFLLAQTEDLGKWASQLTRLPVLSLPERISGAALMALKPFADRNVIFLADADRLIAARRLLRFLLANLFPGEQGERRLRVVVVGERPTDSQGFARLIQTGITYTVLLQEMAARADDPAGGAESKVTEEAV